ncbi:AAA ATPase [Candidatus Mancarchaeum acidiphilum]|uniref:AAA ATPase n=1 Tax=Candidatus Mancarchaeum acidiphilum TaxID=1920749 RepID=A0A218NNK7_9ARCH|nr:ATP-binding protein [Candidatus Mancarchaeum acidiphilum]ASI14036.1 AAA ATPase [Candidatus Mancarchaeum acidiphilum]
MSIVKMQHVMSNEVSKRSFLSRPPEPPANILLNDPMNSIYIGNTKIFKIPFAWNFDNVTNPHIAVVGITGAGKSYFVKTFLIRANYIWDTNAVIIDWASEYKAWVQQSGGTILSLGKGDYINIMDLAGMKPLDRVKQIMGAFEILTDIASYPEQRRLTEEALEQAYANLGFNLAERPPEGKDAPTLKDGIALLEEQLQSGGYQYPAELENAIYRLRQFARPGEDFFSRKSTLDIEKMANSGLVDIDLSGLSDDTFRALAALFILQTLKEKMRFEGFAETKGIKTFVVLDEAWKVASDDRSDAITIVREGRKYQFGLIVASQNPTDINEAIYSNVGTNFILRIKFERFLDYIQGSLNFSPYIRSEISNFGVGQAAVDMSFTTSMRFPNIFVLDRIKGEEPLYIYTINLTDVLTQAEVSANLLPRDYQFEEDELKNKMINYNVSGDIINQLFKKLDSQGRTINMLDFVRTLYSYHLRVADIIALLKSMSIEDLLITRIISSSGVRNE